MEAAADEDDHAVEAAAALLTRKGVGVDAAARPPWQPPGHAAQSTCLAPHARATEAEAAEAAAAEALQGPAEGAT